MVRGGRGITFSSTDSGNKLVFAHPAVSRNSELRRNLTQLTQRQLLKWWTILRHGDSSSQSIRLLQR